MFQHNVAMLLLCCCCCCSGVLECWVFGSDLVSMDRGDDEARQRWTFFGQQVVNAWRVNASATASAVVWETDRGSPHQSDTQLIRFEWNDGKGINDAMALSPGGPLEPPADFASWLPSLFPVDEASDLDLLRLSHGGSF